MVCEHSIIAASGRIHAHWGGACCNTCVGDTVKSCLEQKALVCQRQLRAALTLQSRTFALIVSAPRGSASTAFNREQVTSVDMCKLCLGQRQQLCDFLSKLGFAISGDFCGAWTEGMVATAGTLDTIGSLRLMLRKPRVIAGVQSPWLVFLQFCSTHFNACSRLGISTPFCCVWHGLDPYTSLQPCVSRDFNNLQLVRFGR